MRITNIQKWELSEIFRKAGLNALDFETSGQYKEFKVKFKHEYFSFLFNLQKHDTYQFTIFSANSTKGQTLSGSWEQSKKKFEKWVKEIATELSTPTGWEHFQSDNFLNASYEELNRSFTETERVQTKQSLLELKERIKTLELSNITMTVIDKKLSDLDSRVDELKKFDWKSLFVGTIANLIMTLAIPPDASGLIWEYIKTTFSGFRLKG